MKGENVGDQREGFSQKNNFRSSFWISMVAAHNELTLKDEPLSSERKMPDKAFLK